MDNKKVMGISVAAVVILVIAIIATSYAAFTANLTGTKENVLTSGYVTLNCAETNFTVTNSQAMTDTQGIAATNNAATCTLTSTMVGTMNIGYDIALADVDAASPSDSLTASNVKIQAKKTIDGGSAQYLAGTSSTAGVTVASLASSAGVYDTTNITSYKVDSATLTGNHTVVYTIKSWIASEGSGSTSTTTETDVCSEGTTYTTQSACEAAGGIWGDSQKVSQSGGEFSFKLKLGATQVLS